MSLITIRSVNCAWSDTVPLRFAWACIRRPPSWLPLGRGHKDYGHNGNKYLGCKKTSVAILYQENIISSLDFELRLRHGTQSIGKCTEARLLETETVPKAVNKVTTSLGVSMVCLHRIVRRARVLCLLRLLAVFACDDLQPVRCLCVRFQSSRCLRECRFVRSLSTGASTSTLLASFASTYFHPSGFLRMDVYACVYLQLASFLLERLLPACRLSSRSPTSSLPAVFAIAYLQPAGCLRDRLPSACWLSSRSPTFSLLAVFAIAYLQPSGCLRDRLPLACKLPTRAPISNLRTVYASGDHQAVYGQ
ncbi:unnamed protein product [Arctia plantaginis]|uniref:Uncharacterized protein n=1 Tax=Arctia plantaginis TaxID=874455 RepID=A0A8S1AVF8_ARCPL|nr:unnamed protein product [Arctia plantaginis]